MILIFLCIILFLLILNLFSLWMIAEFIPVSFFKKREGEEKAKGVVRQLPYGEPWAGELKRADDFTQPRYVYENLQESTEYLPQNGKIIGYRIAPDLVIHSTIRQNLNPADLWDFIKNSDGQLLSGYEVNLLRKNWDQISALRVKAGYPPLQDEWFWTMTDRGVTVLEDPKDESSADVIRLPNIWGTLILKR